MSGITLSPHTQVRVQKKGCGFSHDNMPFGVAPTSGGLPAAGARLWLGWAGGLLSQLWLLRVGNWSHWAQGHFELAQGPPLCHPVESKKTDPFLLFLTEGSSLVWLEDRRLGP